VHLPVSRINPNVCAEAYKCFNWALLWRAWVRTKVRKEIERHRGTTEKNEYFSVLAYTQRLSLEESVVKNTPREKHKATECRVFCDAEHKTDTFTSNSVLDNKRIRCARWLLSMTTCLCVLSPCSPTKGHTHRRQEHGRHTW